MTKKTWTIIGVALLLILAVTFFVRNQSSKTESTTNGEVITLQVAHRQDYVPYGFVNEAGEADGYEVAVLQAIDEKLENYQFEYTATSDEDLLIGLESGKYDIGVKGAWYTEERAEKFLIPETAIGASVIGFTIRKEDAAKYTDIDSLAAAKAKLVPISPQNAQYNVIQEYNEANPNQAIELKESESFQVADAYAWVLEGRYDAYFDIKLSYEAAVEDQEGAYHDDADKLSWFAYKGIPTYPLIYKNDRNADFVKAYEKAIDELEKDGTLAELSQKYFGENVFDFVTE